MRDPPGEGKSISVSSEMAGDLGTFDLSHRRLLAAAAIDRVWAARVKGAARRQIAQQRCEAGDPG